MSLIKSALAQDWTELNPNENNGAFWAQGSDWQTILNNVTTIIFIFAGIVAFIYLLYSGFVYLTAGGNPETAKKGQQGLLNAILGLVIIFLAYGIVRFVVSFLSTRGSQ